jgi:hypothetical protein
LPLRGLILFRPVTGPPGAGAKQSKQTDQQPDNTTDDHKERRGMTTSYASQAMGMANANAVARLRLTTFHVCAAPARQWSPISPISAFVTTDRKPGRYRRTPVSTT